MRISGDWCIVRNSVWCHFTRKRMPFPVMSSKVFGVTVYRSLNVKYAWKTTPHKQAAKLPRAIPGNFIACTWVDSPWKGLSEYGIKSLYGGGSWLCNRRPNGNFPKNVILAENVALPKIYFINHNHMCLLAFSLSRALFCFFIFENPLRRCETTALWSQLTWVKSASEDPKNDTFLSTLTESKMKKRKSLENLITDPESRRTGLSRGTSFSAAFFYFFILFDFKNSWALP